MTERFHIAETYSAVLPSTSLARVCRDAAHVGVVGVAEVRVAEVLVALVVLVLIGLLLG